MSQNQQHGNGDSGCLVIIAVLILLAVWSINDKTPDPKKATTAPAVKAVGKDG